MLFKFVKSQNFDEPIDTLPGETILVATSFYRVIWPKMVRVLQSYKLINDYYLYFT